MRTRIQLFVDNGTQYNPVTKKNEKAIELLDMYFCEKSPMTDERQLRTFGKTGVAETVARFNTPIPDTAAYAQIGTEKFIVATLRNYGRESVAYLREVSEW